MCVAISAVYKILERQPHIVRDPGGLVYKDTARKLALLRYSAAFKPKCGYTRETQGWSFNDGGDGYKYFRARGSIARMVSAFFNSDPAHMEYALIVDCTTYIHSCCLFIRRKPVPGGVCGKKNRKSSYIFNAFDPNTTCISECFSQVAREIGAVDTIEVWSAKKGNADGLCFGINWRFIYSIMCEGHNPLANEKIVGVFKLSTNRSKPHPNGNKLLSSIGYVKHRGNKPTTFYFRPKYVASA